MTAKQNGIAPEDYLRCLFEKVPYAETENDWEKLLPWKIADGIVASKKSYPQDESWKTMGEFSNDRVVEDLENRWIEMDKFLEELGYKREGLLYNAVTPNDKSIMCFCHGGIISGIVSHLLNVPFCQLILHMPVHLTSVMKIRLNPRVGTAKLDFILPPEIY